MAQELIVKHLSGSRQNAEETYREFPLKIGRSDECQLYFDPQLDAKVSALHAEIRRQDGGGGFVVVDLDSTNGVILNGARVEGTQELPRQATLEVGVGGPKLSLETVEGGSGISFSAVRRKTDSGGQRRHRPMVSTESGMQAYVPEGKPKTPFHVPMAAIVVVVVAALAVLLLMAMS